MDLETGTGISNSFWNFLWAVGLHALEVVMINDTERKAQDVGVSRMMAYNDLLHEVSVDEKYKEIAPMVESVCDGFVSEVAYWKTRAYDLSGRLNEVMLVPGVADLVKNWDEEKTSDGHGHVKPEESSLLGDTVRPEVDTGIGVGHLPKI